MGGGSLPRGMGKMSQLINTKLYTALTEEMINKRNFKCYNSFEYSSSVAAFLGYLLASTHRYFNSK